MGSRRRARPWREVKAVTIAVEGPIGGGGEESAEVSVLLSGLSSLLQIGLHLAFFPKRGARPDDANFTGNTFEIFGWTADERGQRVQLASEAITGTTAIQAPDGWEGRTELDQLELRASLTFTGTEGDWRAIVVLEPADGAMCEQVFAQLVGEVDLQAGHPPEINGGT